MATTTVTASWKAMPRRRSRRDRGRSRSLTATEVRHRGGAFAWRLGFRLAALLCGPVAVWAAYDSAVAYWLQQPPMSVPAVLQANTALRWAAVQDRLTDQGWLAANQPQVKAAALAHLRESLLDSSALRALGQIEAVNVPSGGVTQFRNVERVTRRDGLNQLQLIGIAQQAGDFADGMRHYDRLLVTAPDAAETLFPTLAKAIAFPEVRDPLAAYASREWFVRFLLVAIDRGADPAAVVDLYAQTRRVLAQSARQSVGLRLVAQLLAAARLADARNVAATIPGYGPALRDQFAISTVTANAALAPLAWTLHNDEAIETTLTAPGQLAVRIANGRPSIVAERLMLTDPGRYLIAHDVRYDSGESAAALTWTVTCTNGGKIVTLPVPVAPGRHRFSAAIDIPDGCGGQTWQLSATPEDALSASSVTIDGLSLVP